MAASELARRKLERTKDLVRRDFVSDQALDQAEAEARVAEQRVEQAREGQRVAQREFQLSNAQLSQREVRSPFAGLVVERYRTEGERIEREPVVRVARIDPLRIEAIVPAVQFGSIAAGQMATVKTDLPNYAVLSAKVTLVDRVIDPASNSFRVRLSLPNPGNRIPSGVRCRIAFGANDGVPSGVPGQAEPSPSAAAQIAPARWPQAPETSQGVMTVSAPLNRPVHATALPNKPPRFLSSTLKLAMAELAKTSPGKRWAGDEVPARLSAKRPPQRPYPVMAMTVQMPSLGQTGAVPARAPVVADARKPSAAVGGAPLPTTGVRLASVR